MNKEKELAQALNQLIAAATAVRDCLGADKAPKAEAESVKKETPNVEAEPAYTFADVRKAFSAKAHAGFTEQIKSLITAYGADKLSAIREADYPNLMKDLEAIQ